MAKFRGFCHYCRNTTLFEIKAADIKTGPTPTNPWAKVRLAVQCPVCRNFSVIFADINAHEAARVADSMQLLPVLIKSPIELDPHIQIVKTIPTMPTFPDLKIPEEVAELFRDAYKNLYELREPSPRMAVIALSSTLETALKKALGKPPKSSAQLASLIDQAYQNHLITEAVKDWAHALRLTRNLAVHTSASISPEYARELYQFTHILLTVLFDLPARIQEFREKAVQEKPS